MHIGQDGHEHGMGMAWVCPLKLRSVVFYPIPFLPFLSLLSFDFFRVPVCVCLLKKKVVAFLPLRFSSPLGHRTRAIPSVYLLLLLPFFFPSPSHIFQSLFFVVGWLNLLRFLSPSFALAPSYDWIPLFLLTSLLEVHTSSLPFPFSCLS